jgi:serine/threonine protein phosphatase PrpC
MARSIHLSFAAATDTGLQRAHNEDAIAHSDPCRYAIVADGMGGYNAGEVASAMAVATLRKYLDDLIPGYEGRARGRQIRALLADAIFHANGLIHAAAQNDIANRGMATTLVMALFHRRLVTVAHVGDSRAYRLRDGVLEQLTRDHSEVQGQLDRGEITPAQARLAPNRNVVTRGLGVTPGVDIDVASYRVAVGDCYLLCSDGLTDLLDDDAILAIVDDPDLTLRAACDALVDAANAYGGKDNISVILVKASAPADNGVLGRMLGWMAAE